MNMMASALFQLSSGSFLQPKEMITGMRAIAFCIEEITQTRHTNEVLDTVMEQVEDVMRGARSAIKDLLGGVKTALKEAEERITKEKLEERGADDVKKAVEKVMKLTYSQALANRRSSRMEARDLQIRMDTKIRGQLQCRQIILDSDDTMREQISKLTPKEILYKANLRLEKLSKKPDNAKFVAARILKNGGVLLKMVTENGAEWLKQEEISRHFEWCFPGKVTIKGNTYQVVVQFLSTALRNRLEEITTVTKEENKMPQGAIVSAK